LSFRLKISERFNFTDAKFTVMHRFPTKSFVNSYQL